MMFKRRPKTLSEMASLEEKKSKKRISETLENTLRLDELQEIEDKRAREGRLDDDLDTDHDPDSAERNTFKVPAYLINKLVPTDRDFQDMAQAKNPTDQSTKDSLDLLTTVALVDMLSDHSNNGNDRSLF